MDEYGSGLMDMIDAGKVSHNVWGHDDNQEYIIEILY